MRHSGGSKGGGDDLSPFRLYARKSRHPGRGPAKRGLINNADALYLQKVLANQGGKCPLTGITFPSHSPPRSERGKPLPNNASLDRIDSNQGYKKGNVRFLTYIANVTKGPWTDKDILEFAQGVIETNSNPVTSSFTQKGELTWAEFQAFRRKIYRRRNKKEIDPSINASYLHSIFEIQQGTCPLTGWPLFIESNSFRTASIDRIDSSKGYIKGNIRFIALIANQAKASWTDQEVIEFARAVVQTHSPGPSYQSKAIP